MSAHLEQLIESGKQKGHVLCEEIDELLPGDYEGGPELDGILAALESAGVEVVAERNLEPPEHPTGDADKPVQVYLRELCAFPPLPPDDEVALARLNTEEARVQLIEANLRRVVSIAKHYANRGVHLLELIQDGNMGLGSAVKAFDPERGYRFSPYAAWWVRRSIIRRLSQ
jgi:DNA-directed RNA polymerase sigma subunit (sigma70/sigma32)